MSGARQRPLSIAVHGGAGTIDPSALTPELEAAYREALSTAVRRGHGVLVEGGSALDAVVAAVRVLEDTPLFNAGRGSVFSAEGVHEMDAAVMEGATLGAGAVAGVRNVKNPVALARRVMERSGHVLLSGRGAFEFAHAQKMELEEDDYFFDRFRYEQWQAVRGTAEVRLDHQVGERKFGTVGAVALDAHGDLAAATSTGGMTNKRWMRIGDSPLIGAGNYCDNRYGAVGCTGMGELAIRVSTARSIVLYMKMGMSLLEAGLESLRDLQVLDARAGQYMNIVAMTPDGAHAGFTTVPGTQYLYMTGDMATPQLAERTSLPD